MKRPKVRCPACTREVAVKVDGSLVRHGHWRRKDGQRAFWDACKGTGLGGDWLLAKQRGAPPQALEAVPDVMWIREDLAKQIWPERAAEIEAALVGDTIEYTVLDEAPNVSWYLHPDGRCRCAGEGTCEWCQRHCLHCGQPWMLGVRTCGCEIPDPEAA